MYVGVSAGSMLAAPIFGETCRKPYGNRKPAHVGRHDVPCAEGEITMNFITARERALPTSR